MPFPPRLPTALAFAEQGLTSGAANRMLQVLYAATAVLAVVLLLVIALAAVVWHKNKDKDLRP